MSKNQEAYQRHYTTVKQSLGDFCQGTKTEQQHDRDVEQSRKRFEKALAEESTTIPQKIDSGANWKRER